MLPLLTSSLTSNRHAAPPESTPLTSFAPAVFCIPVVYRKQFRGGQSPRSPSVENAAVDGVSTRKRHGQCPVVARQEDGVVPAQGHVHRYESVQSAANDRSAVAANTGFQTFRNPCRLFVRGARRVFPYGFKLIWGRLDADRSSNAGRCLRELFRAPPRLGSEPCIVRLPVAEAR